MATLLFLLQSIQLWSGTSFSRVYVFRRFFITGRSPNSLGCHFNPSTIQVELSSSYHLPKDATQICYLLPGNTCVFSEQCLWSYCFLQWECTPLTNVHVPEFCHSSGVSPNTSSMRPSLISQKECTLPLSLDIFQTRGRSAAPDTFYLLLHPPPQIHHHLPRRTEASWG